MAFVSRDVRVANAGRRVEVQTNSFRMHFPTRVVHHYDVIQPQWETSSSDFKIGSKKNNEIVMRVQATHPEVFHRRAAFDGRKNLFAPIKYFAQHEFIVSWDQNPEHDRKKREVSVSMTHVNAIDFGILQHYLNTRQLSPENENQVNLILNMLNVFVQATPKQKAGVLSSVKSIFVQSEKKQPMSIAPLELWRGYFQSVRPAFDRIIINVDVTIGVVLPAADLEMVCGNFLKIRNPRDLKQLRPDQYSKLRQFLKGIKIQINLGKHSNRSPRVIRDLVKDVGAVQFDRGGQTVTVGQHFRELYNMSIPPSTLGVKVQKEVFPIGCCRTVEQLYKNRVSPEVVREALTFTPADPRQRASEIVKAFNHFDYSNSHFLVNAGIQVDNQPELVNGRILQPPSIIFANQSERKLGDRPGVWDVMRERLASPATIQSWVAIDFAGVNPRDLQYFIEELINAMQARGISVTAPLAVERRSIQANVLSEMAALKNQYDPRLILAVLPDPAEDQYRKIKRFGDITQGVATQCVRWSNNLARNVSSRKINQYQNNLILKVNPKMGGINFLAKSGALFQLSKMGPFMIVGADVSHPGPGSQFPSIASVVGSFDKDACRYAASIGVQSSRVEMIEDFGNMFREILGNFQAKCNGVLPKNIVIFRDGVSEGEFLNVEALEYDAMKGVFSSFYSGDAKMWPKVTYLVVGKRHHVRFFPRSSSTADPRGNSNFPAGLVVDNEIVHPRYCDFYLQSQPGLKGTSIPSHYTILKNSIGIPMDGMQDLAYALCHCYSRSTRSVKIPAPVYYADLVCRRAKFHFDESIHDFSISSVSGEEDSDSALANFRAHFNPVNGRMKDRMYFV